jgi:Toastrack DUF4097
MLFPGGPIDVDFSNRMKKCKAAQIIPWASVLFLLSLGLNAVASPAHLDKAFQTTPNPEVALTNLRGKLVVHGWDKESVQAQCTTLSPRVEVDAETLPHSGPAERVQLSAHLLDPLVTGEDETMDCVLQVPRGASVEIRNRQGSVKIELVNGQHTRVESTNGTISATDISGHLFARTLGGDIEIVRASGRVEAFSITGGIRFVDATSKDLRGNSNSGKIIYQGDFVPGAEYVLSTYSGDIEILCPAASSFQLTAKTVKGKVDNEFSLTPRRRDVSPLSSAHSLLGTSNTGDAMVELSSFSGTIRLRPQR